MIKCSSVLANLKWILLTGIGFLSIFAFAPNPAPDLIEVIFEEESRLFLKGSTNVNHFSCDSHESFPLRKIQYQSYPELKRITFSSAPILVKVELLDCGQREINKDLQKALQVDEYPYIMIRLESAALTDNLLSMADGEWKEVLAQTNVEIAGITRPVELCLQYQWGAEKSLHLKGKQCLLMTDFGIDPPAPLMGLIKVRDQIEIHFDFLLHIRE